jgi:hypothetical protein
LKAIYKPPPDEFGTTREPDSSGPEFIVQPPFMIGGWLLDMLRARATDTDIVGTLQQRVLDGKSDLHEAQHILNEVGRHRGGAAVLKRFVTQEIITQLARRG